jgi:hypothetical protein
VVSATVDQSSFEIASVIVCMSRPSDFITTRRVIDFGGAVA